ncbi:uncharacterized protein LOC128259707 [Drosophila gunungcola]|uniref:Uncharacterized protein n=1 Tax=Drosophila gunungcola TaxID=103775 RepID=A0A9P9YJM1_9MUSC|nr:uncharacterized protein LOC128259707 [Drosophila gunungcola]KAI8037948.1 hypothetical protein M5D96_009449 [Drosophila gunungcola]
MAARLLSILQLGGHILPKRKFAHQSLYFARGMARRKDQSQNTEKGKKTCPKNQFFGGCFKNSEPFRRENKKEKAKRCRDPCKDGPCRPEK